MSVYISRQQAMSNRAMLVITIVTDVKAAQLPLQPLLRSFTSLPLVCHFPVNPPLPPSTATYAQPANHRAGQRHSCRRGRQQRHLDAAYRGLGRRPWPVSWKTGSGFRVWKTRRLPLLGRGSSEVANREESKATASLGLGLGRKGRKQGDRPGGDVPVKLTTTHMTFFSSCTSGAPSPCSPGPWSCAP